MPAPESVGMTAEGPYSVADFLRDLTTPRHRGLPYLSLFVPGEMGPYLPGSDLKAGMRGTADSCFRRVVRFSVQTSSPALSGSAHDRRRQRRAAFRKLSDARNWIYEVRAQPDGDECAVYTQGQLVAAAQSALAAGVA